METLHLHCIVTFDKVNLFFIMFILIFMFCLLLETVHCWIFQNKGFTTEIAFFLYYHQQSKNHNIIVRLSKGYLETLQCFINVTATLC